jgi:hypothetical protein
VAKHTYDLHYKTIRRLISEGFILKFEKSSANLAKMRNIAYEAALNISLIENARAECLLFFKPPSPMKHRALSGKERVVRVCRLV